MLKIDPRYRMSERRVLMVEDEQDIRDMLRFSLEQSGYLVLEAEDATKGLDIVNSERPHLILLDWMLPDMTGIEFIRRLKNQSMTKQIPIIMLTARSQESDKIKGLEVGADDYLPKPFSIKELLARIKAVLRRTGAQAEEFITHNELHLDLKAHRLLIKSKAVHIGPTEFRLLAFLCSHPDRAYSREQLLNFVWGDNIYVEDRTVDVHILRLRKILQPYHLDHLIQTVRGAGYRFSTYE